MSKFIAILCAAAMLATSSCIALAEETTDVDYGEDNIVYSDENSGTDEGTATDDSSANQSEDSYIDESVKDSSDEVEIIDITPMQNKDEAANNESQTADTDAKADEAATDSIFTDVPADAYYSDAVKFCYERGLFNGVSDTEFAPDMTMTRGMFATVFGRIQNADLTNVTLTYEDVKADAYYASYIAWATKEGIMDGYSDTEFGPDDAITREQAAKMLHAYLGNVKNISIADVAADYADIDKVSDWAAKAVNANTSVGYLRADENNNINPTSELTRADACYAVATTINLVEALEAEGLKDAEESAIADEDVIEVTDPKDEVTPLEQETTKVDTQAQMGEIPEADKDQVTEDFQPYPGTEYNPIDEY